MVSKTSCVLSSVGVHIGAGVNASLDRCTVALNDSAGSRLLQMELASSAVGSCRSVTCHGCVTSCWPQAWKPHVELPRTVRVMLIVYHLCRAGVHHFAGSGSGSSAVPGVRALHATDCTFFSNGAAGGCLELLELAGFCACIVGACDVYCASHSARRFVRVLALTFAALPLWCRIFPFPRAHRSAPLFNADYVEHRGEHFAENVFTVHCRSCLFAIFILAALGYGAYVCCWRWFAQAAEEHEHAHAHQLAQASAAAAGGASHTRRRSSITGKTGLLCLHLYLFPSPCVLPNASCCEIHMILRASRLHRPAWRGPQRFCCWTIHTGSVSPRGAGRHAQHGSMSIAGAHLFFLCACCS